MPEWARIYTNEQIALFRCWRRHDVFRADLWDLERSEPHVASKLENKIIAMRGGRSTQPVEFVVGQAVARLVATGVLADVDRTVRTTFVCRDSLDVVGQFSLENPTVLVFDHLGDVILHDFERGDILL
nr:hypothetical protein [Halocatena marina]